MAGQFEKFVRVGEYVKTCDMADRRCMHFKLLNEILETSFTENQARKWLDENGGINCDMGLVSRGDLISVFACSTGLDYPREERGDNVDLIRKETGKVFRRKFPNAEIIVDN